MKLLKLLISEDSSWDSPRVVIFCEEYGGSCFKSRAVSFFYCLGFLCGFRMVAFAKQDLYS